MKASDRGRNVKSKEFFGCFDEFCTSIQLLLLHGSHKPGKPGILRDFSERGKLRELYATSGTNCNEVVLVRRSNICVKQLWTG